MILNMTTTGGVGLNYKIYTDPEGAQKAPGVDFTIWAKTDKTIWGHSISPKAPDVTTEGYLWIKSGVDEDEGVVISAVKVKHNQSITLFLIGAYLYDNGAWRPIDAYVWYDPYGEEWYQFSSVFEATITVTYPEGSTCTCSDGTTTLVALDATGDYAFTVPNTGTWTISCTDGKNFTSCDVIITNNSQTEVITLGYSFAYTYSGDSSFRGNAAEDWELHLLTSGTLTVTDLGACNGVIDMYILGGGGGAADGSFGSECLDGDTDAWRGGAGGGGGYTINIMDGSIVLSEGSDLSVTIGSGGAVGYNGKESKVIIDDNSYIANGGKAGKYTTGGAGGSGGGGGGVLAGGNGGTNGNNGKGSTATARYFTEDTIGGSGQGTSTLPFCEPNDIPYGAGGGGGGAAVNSVAGTVGNEGANGGSTANQGMGGKGKSASIGIGSLSYTTGSAGGSGIVIIRNHRAVES